MWHTEALSLSTDILSESQSFRHFWRLLIPPEILHPMVPNHSQSPILRLNKRSKSIGFCSFLKTLMFSVGVIDLKWCVEACEVALNTLRWMFCLSLMYMQWSLLCSLWLAPFIKGMFKKTCFDTYGDASKKFLQKMDVLLNKPTTCGKNNCKGSKSSLNGRFYVPFWPLFSILKAKGETF